MKKYKFWSRTDYRECGEPIAGWDDLGMNHLFNQPVTKEFFDLVESRGKVFFEGKVLRKAIRDAGGILRRDADYGWTISFDMLRCVDWVETECTTTQLSKKGAKVTDVDLSLLLI